MEDVVNSSFKEAVRKIMNEEVLVFSLKGALAHFRQPDTTATHATYPFPPRPTIHGLLASILGINFDTGEGEDFLKERHLVGLALLNPVRTVFAQMSLHGKGFTSGSGTFNRLTTVELLVSPHYLVYYAGSRLGELAQRIMSGQSVYHTYLGSAYCLTFPIYQGLYRTAKIVPNGKPLNLSTVIPQEAVQEIVFESEGNYAIARALPYRHIGNRMFEQTINVLYETNGRPLRIMVEQNRKINCKFIGTPDGKVICLW